MRLPIRLICLVLIFTIIKTAESKMTMEQIKNTMKPFKNSCLKKTSIDTALVEGTKSGEFPADRNLMCFLKCILQMMKVLKNGEISINSIMTQIDIMMPEEYADRVKDMCRTCADNALKFEDPCESSYHFVKCFYETDSELYFFP